MSWQRLRADARRVGEAFHSPIRSVPLWALVVFAVAIAVAYSPGIVRPAAIHGNYEALVERSHGLFHSDADRMVEFARPVSALLSNLPLLPLQEVSDLGWVRGFSVLTVCLLGTLVIGICVQYLRTRPLIGLVAAIAVFLVPAFSYSILEPAAWAPHLVAILIALVAYALLCRSNVQSLAFLVLVDQRDFAGFARQVVAYAGHRDVLLAGAMYLLAFYDYPPAAFVLALFPVLMVLFAQVPARYRTLFAVRDMGFIAGVVVLYLVSLKLIYLPVVGLFVKAPPYDPSFATKVGNTYAFDLQMHLEPILARFAQSLRVAGDLWFLPQLRIHAAVAALVLLTLAAAIVASLWKRSAGADDRIASTWGREAFNRVAIVGACLAIAASPTLFSVGGIITYRTLSVPTAIVALVTLYCVAELSTNVWQGIGNPRGAADRVADGVLVLTAVAAVAVTFYANRLTATLGRNEYAYFKALVQQAIDRKVGSVVWLDSRPLFLSEDIPEVVDRDGRWIPPFELGCFTSYCISSQSIVRAVLADLGTSIRAFELWTPRGDPAAAGVTCTMFTAGPPSYPPNATRRIVELIDYFRQHGPVMCIDYDLSWHVAR